MGQIMILKNANSKIVINEVKSRVAEIQKTLPEGVFINPILERSELISKKINGRSRAGFLKSLVLLLQYSL